MGGIPRENMWLGGKPRDSSRRRREADHLTSSICGRGRERFVEK